MMRTTLLASALLALLLAAGAPKSDNDRIILLTEGFQDSTWVFLEDMAHEVLIDSGFVLGNKLVLSAKVSEPTDFLLRTDFDDAFEYKTFWKEDQPVTIRAKRGKLAEAIVTGSEAQRQADLSLASKEQLLQALSKVKEEMETLKSEDKERWAELVAKTEEIRTQMRQLDVDYIQRYPDYWYSAVSLSYLVFYQPKEQVKELYDLLSPALKDNQYGLQAKRYIELSKDISVGGSAAMVAAPTLSGDLASLADFTGKYVLLEFWASNCWPCREENPNLLKNYRRFKDQGFEIFSISLDKNRDNWQNAVQRDTMIWTSVCDLNGYGGHAPATYKVYYLPKNYLIDTNGIVIAEDLRGEELSQRLSEIFSK